MPALLGLVASTALASAATPPSRAADALRGLRGGAAEPAALITGAGELQAATAAKVAGSVAAGAPLSLVSSVGGQHRGRRLLNALFGTSFDGALQLGPAGADAAGAWLASATSDAGRLVLEARPQGSSGQQRSPADSCKLTCFALALSDALLVHSPCVAPTAALVKESYERIFSHHLAAMMPSGVADARTLLVHVADPAETLSEAQVRAACKDAWSTAAATTEFKGKAFSDLFDLEVVTVPAEGEDAAGFAAGVQTLQTVLSSASGKLKGASAFADAATAAWSAAGSLLDGEPSETWLRERYLAARSYEAAYGQAQEMLRKWAPQVAKGNMIRGFGPEATAMLASALATFDGGISSCSAASAPMLAQRRQRLLKALQNDAQELFVKQHRQLTSSTIAKFKAQLLKVMGRGGTVAEWQQEGLRKNAEKHFDAAVGQLMVDGIGEQSRAQLVSAFSKQLTELTAKFLDSPPMQLQAIGAMRRRTGKGQKPPRGIRAGLGLVGACRNSFGGGQGNIQTYAGYVDGLNSVHVMFANDGLVPDSSGAEPPPLRWQPKFNFDISI